ncbi:glycosyltransferase [Saccharophagus sp. K07]|uniref:glycosyltransferase family 2 protein n=1 Tax=Saccharophagus sp. K07 TaxID=2283636 RepID=UPI0016522265|nr:glycosyltransferase [Saccharophagus sp. K07]MBC6904361.1 glycosyltransferase [Saccharophagus sp. K07]
MNISVVVPVYQHWNLTEKLFKGLAGQTLPQDQWEVLMVDNGSDHVPAAEELPSFVKLLHCAKPGSYAARNVALDHARGELLVFTDADCCPCPNWLSHLWQTYLESDKRSLIAGGIEVARLEAGRHTLVELYDMALGLSQARYVKNGYAVTANLAIPRQIFAEIGKFDESRFSGGDREICLRAKSEGFPMLYQPAALVQHPARQRWSELVAKVKRIKGGKIRSGTLKERTISALRTYMPPVWACLSIIKNRRFSVLQKLGILWVQISLWGVEMVEVTCLLLGKQPERK